MLKKYDDLEDGKIYYTVKEKWSFNWKRLLYNFNQSPDFLPKEGYESLESVKSETNDIILGLFTIPIKISIKDWEKSMDFIDLSLKEKLIDWLSKQIDTAVQASIELDSIMNSLEEYKNEILSSVSFLESFFVEYQESERKKIYEGLFSLTGKIYDILDSEVSLNKVITEWIDNDQQEIIDNKMNQIDEILSNFIKSLPHKAVVDIARWVFKELEETAEEYLYKKLNISDESISVGLWENIPDQYFQAKEELRKWVYSFNNIFQKPEDINSIDFIIESLFQDCLTLVENIKEYPQESEIQNIHLKVTEVLKNFWLKFLNEEEFSEAVWYIVEYRNNMSHINSAIWGLLSAKKYTQEVVQENITIDNSSIESLVEKIIAYKEEENCLNDHIFCNLIDELKNHSTEKINSLSKEKLEEINAFLISNQIQAFELAAKIRDIISAKL